MTIIVNPPAAEVERASREHVAALMLRAVRDHGLSWPRDIHHMEGAESGDLLDIGIDGRGPWLGWVDFFGEPEYRSGLSVHIPWRGWTVLLSYREVATQPAETAALIDEVTFDGPDCAICGKPVRPGQEIVAGHQPMTVVHAACDDPTCRSCGGEMIHQIGCPDGPEHLADHYAADPPMLCTRCGDPLLPGQLIEQRTAGRVHVGCELGPQCIDCGVLGGGRQESCAFAARVSAWTCPPCTRPGHFTAPDHTFTEGCRYEPGVFAGPRVDPEAAAKIPVLVLDVTPNPAPSPDIDDTIAALIADPDEPIPYTPFDPDAREYVPAGAYDSPAVQDAIRATTAQAVVHYRTPDQWTACGHDPRGTDTRHAERVTCPDCLATLPPSALDEPTQEIANGGLHVVPTGLPLLVHGHVPVAPGHHDVQIVEVTDVELGPLVERDDNAAMARVLPSASGCARCATSHPHAADTHSYTEGCVHGPNPTAAALMARVLPPQTSFAEAVERLADVARAGGVA